MPGNDTKPADSLGGSRCAKEKRPTRTDRTGACRLTCGAGGQALQVTQRQKRRQRCDEQSEMNRGGRLGGWDRGMPMKRGPQKLTAQAHAISPEAMAARHAQVTARPINERLQDTRKANPVAGSADGIAG